VNAVVEQVPGRDTLTAAVPPPMDAPATDADAVAAVWARVQLARHLQRPRTLELIAAGLAEDFIELHGDRLFRDDPAIVGGLARIGARHVVIVGHQKGAETEENIRRNFGMAHPEGYRKAMRLMALAERFGLPVVTFVDTPGASPGPEAEERGVAEAIAQSIALMSRLRTPIVTVITGEGGSGGALAIAVGDVVVALENATYSVITPEGCASILWRSPDAAPRAAVAMKMTAREQQMLGVIDRVVEEPGAGAQTDHAETARRLRAVILEELNRLDSLAVRDLLGQRYARYRAIGDFSTSAQGPMGPSERQRLSDRLRNLVGAGLEVGRDTLGGLGRRRDDPQPPARDEV
jgi:acetyl-CoA carboxylase carboxyl transferase subunit alpha